MILQNDPTLPNPSSRGIFLAKKRGKSILNLYFFTRISMDLTPLLSKSEKTLLYFYPKDNTPGCTMEAQDFTRLK